MKNKNSVLTKILSFLVWLAGVIVSLAVGFALKDKILSVPHLGIANQIAGWIVIITTLLGVLITLINSLMRK
jgi:hypothetical protein